MKYANVDLESVGHWLDVIVDTRLLHHKIYDISKDIDYQALPQRNPLSRIPNSFRKLSIFCTWQVKVNYLSKGMIDLATFIPDYIKQSDYYYPRSLQERRKAGCSKLGISMQIGEINLWEYCTFHKSKENDNSIEAENILKYNIDELCSLMDVIIFGAKTQNKLFKDLASWSADPTITLLLILKVLVPTNGVHKDVDYGMLRESYKRLYYFLDFYTSRDPGYDNTVYGSDIRSLALTGEIPPRIYAVYFTKLLLNDYISYKNHMNFEINGVPETYSPNIDKNLYEGFTCENGLMALINNSDLMRMPNEKLIHFEKIDGFCLMHIDTVIKDTHTINRNTFICQFMNDMNCLDIRPLNCFNKVKYSMARFYFNIAVDDKEKNRIAVCLSGFPLMDGFEKIIGKRIVRYRQYLDDYQVVVRYHFISKEAKQKINSNMKVVIFQIDNNTSKSIDVSKYPFLKKLNREDKCYYIEYGDDKYLYFPNMNITLSEDQFN